MRMRHVLPGLVVLVMFQTGCNPGFPPAQDDDQSSDDPSSGDRVPGDPTSYEVDEAVEPSRAEVAGLDAGPARPVGTLIGPDGRRDEFVANEIVFRPSSPEDLESFLARYNGTVLRDGTPILLPEAPPDASAASSGWYLIRVDTEQSSLDDLSGNMSSAGLEGDFVFSSEAAARLMAIVAREDGGRAQPNLVLSPSAVPEHPDGSGGSLDAERWAWMTEDDDPQTPGDQGLSTGVVHAWEYVRYKNVPPSPESGETVTWDPPILAIVDAGYDLDPATGAPNAGNLDFRNSLDPPRQIDLAQNDQTAGGPNTDPCSGGVPCPWHGQSVFGVAAAYPRNGFGSAGTGGPVARPLLIRIDESNYGLANGIRTAALNGADVINVSQAGVCNWACRNAVLDPDQDDMFHINVDLAHSLGAVVVAGAGNDGVDISDINMLPCKAGNVICVGSIDRQKRNRYNHGDGVDLWAPEDIRSTVTPASASIDADDTGIDELHRAFGTSASTPFVSGIVALMKALDPTLRHDRVLSILRDTANPSPDPIVHGYVDAYRAVRAVDPNEPPIVRVTLIEDGETLSYARREGVGAEIADEAGSDFLSLGGTITYASSRDGELCVVGPGNPTGHFCLLPELSAGRHELSATAEDPFGEVGIDSIGVTVINEPPRATIISPENNATFQSDQMIAFNGSGFDPDLQTDEVDLAWASDLDGALGEGAFVVAMLSTGDHVVTLTATDERNRSGTDEISLSVQPGEGRPSAVIASPAPGSNFSPGMVVHFEGSGSDPEDGELTGERLVWSSDVDGILGNGQSIDVVLSGPETPCNPEQVKHNITLTATDSDGRTAIHEIFVRVGFIC